MISLNEDMMIREVRTGVATRKPIHDPTHFDIAEWICDAGTEFKPHSHDIDQFTYIIKGKMILKEGNKEYTLTPGCYYYTPAGETHVVVAIVEQTTMLVVKEVR